MSSPAVSSGPCPTAGLARRLAAGAYDLLLLAGLLMLVGFAVIVAREGEAVRPGAWWFQLLIVGTSALFYTGFWSRDGQTLGMRAWRLRVVRANGEPPGFGLSLLRFAAALLSLLPAGLGLFWVLFDREHRAWHDRLTGTRVIVLPKSLSGRAPASRA